MADIKYEDSLECRFPILAKEWNKDKNLGITPTEISSKSGIKVWWICSRRHEWQARIADRTAGHGCPYCSGRKAIPGETDLPTLFPNLMKEWDYEKNIGIEPCTIRPGTHRKIYWICEKGHSWEATVKNRVNGSGCPYCSGHLPILGETDLLTTHPQLSREWDYLHNADITPQSVTKYSNKIVWWHGDCGHVWQDSITHRTAGRGCPECNSRNKTSFPEQAIYFYIQKEYPDAENRFTEFFTNGMELDVFIPEVKIGIEYDGSAWHSDANALQREKIKYKICKEYGITLIRIKEKNYDDTKAGICDICLKTLDDLDKTISQLSKYVRLPKVINTDKDRRTILENYYRELKRHSLQTLYPDIAKEWHPTKNGALTASMFSAKSGERVWWICKLGHEWETPIRDRTATGDGCPYCSNHRILSGFNDLATKYPRLAEEWHPTKNDKMYPDSVLAGGRMTVWWKCSFGHEWQAKISDRVKGRNCPYCANKKVLLGFNDLATTLPEVAVEWHPTKNKGLNPTDVTSGSSKTVWWLCSICGNEWQAKIEQRKHGSGCPVCADKKKTQSYMQTMVSRHGSLAHKHPELLADWDYEKNNGINPSEISAHSTLTVWWKCSQCGNCWKTSVYSRTENGSGCAKCSTKNRIASGLATRLEQSKSLGEAYPDIAEQWDYVKNGTLTPDQVLPFSNEKVWWHCEKGHEWEMPVSARSSGSNCPYCASRRLLKGFNDLLTLNPKLASEWDYKLNGSLSPDMVMPNSTKKVFWKCAQGHSWEAQVSNRNKGSGCPICAGNRVVRGVNDLVTTSPNLLLDWDMEENSLIPETLCEKSRKVIFWKCHLCGYKWKKSVVARVQNPKCPHCQN